MMPEYSNRRCKVNLKQVFRCWTDLDSPVLKFNILLDESYSACFRSDSLQVRLLDLRVHQKVRARD